MLNCLPLNLNITFRNLKGLNKATSTMGLNMNIKPFPDLPISHYPQKNN